MIRWAATVAILALMALTVFLPQTSIGRRGTETTVRAHVGDRAGRIGEPMPDFALADLDGDVIRLSDLRGHRVLITFERSVDW